MDTPSDLLAVTRASPLPAMLTHLVGRQRRQVDVAAAGDGQLHLPGRAGGLHVAAAGHAQVQRVGAQRSSGHRPTRPSTGFSVGVFSAVTRSWPDPAATSPAGAPRRPSP
jgi:hypothetical protein